MKNALKYFLLIILGFITLWGCQQDDLYNNELSSLASKGMVKKMSLKDLNKDSEAYRILERFKPSDKKDNVLFKNIVQTDYGFSVDTDEFLYIEDNDKNSYTFRVYRDDNTNELENLVLNYNSETESYDTFLIEYLVENDDYQNILNNQEIDDFSSKTKVTFLPEFDSGSLIQARVHTSIFYDCTYSVTYVPALAGEATGIYLDYVPVYTLVDCTITNISSSGNDVPFVVGGDGEFSGGGPFNGTGPVGGSSSSHNSGNSNPTIVTVPYENIKYAKRDFFINNILSQEERDFFTDLENYEIRNLIFQYLDDSETNISAMSMITGYNNTDAVDFAKWGVGFLKDNPDVSFEDLLNNRTGFDVETGDFDNNTVGGYDNTPYEMVNLNNLQQDWPTIESVIPASDFVGWDRNLPDWHCMDYAKAQIAKKGYTISNYYAPGQTFQIYKENTGVDADALWEGISYLKYALSNGIPVIVGIDNQPGSPNPYTDNTTDHFVVIVGTGVSSEGEIYFTFFDNAASTAYEGAHSQNKFFLDTVLNMLVGTTQVAFYRNRYTEYSYIVTQIRKSK